MKEAGLNQQPIILTKAVLFQFMVVTVLLVSGVLVQLLAEVELVPDPAHAQIPHHNMAAMTVLDWDQVLKVKVASVTIVQVREKKAGYSSIHST